MPYAFDLPSDLYREMWEAGHFLSAPLREATAANRVGIAVEGFSVPHVHVHLIPLYHMADLDPCREKPLPAAEADEPQAKIVDRILALGPPPVVGAT